MNQINNIFRFLLRNDVRIIWSIPSGIWGSVEAITYFTGDWLKNFLGSYWLIIYVIPGTLLIFFIVRNLNRTEDDESQPNPPVQLAQSGVRITCQRPNLPIQFIREALEYNLAGAIETIHCHVNGENNNYILDWKDIIFIPLENGHNHIRIKYNISNHIILSSTFPFLRPIFDPFKLMATHEARQSEYREGGHVESCINIPQPGTVKNYIYRPSPESLWAGGQLEEIQERDFR